MVQFFPLLCCDLSVFAFSDPVQSQIHDPDPFQLLYLISQIPAHSADLPVQSLRQHKLLHCQKSGKLQFDFQFLICKLHAPSSFAYSPVPSTCPEVMISISPP